MYNLNNNFAAELCFFKGTLNASADSLDPCQPAPSAQADMRRNFSLSLNVLHVKGYIEFSRLLDEMGFMGPNKVISYLV